MQKYLKEVKERRNCFDGECGRSGKRHGGRNGNGTCAETEGISEGESETGTEGETETATEVETATGIETETVLETETETRRLNGNRNEATEQWLKQNGQRQNRKMLKIFLKRTQ